jgi:hypothetical protein
MKYKLFLCLALILSGYTQLRAGSHQLIGNFKYNSSTGFVSFENKRKSLELQVGIDGIDSKKLSADEIWAWVLLKNGMALQLREKAPKQGAHFASVDNAGSKTSYVMFSFDNPNTEVPEAIVLECNHEYHIFPITHTP